MSKNELYKLISLMMSFNTNDSYYFSDMIFDEKINDCLSKFYFSMLSQKDIEKDKYYNEFEKLYLELDEEQKEVVKEEVAKILEIEYKPKVKKKER